jgi:hypothetical protein
MSHTITPERKKQNIKKLSPILCPFVRVVFEDFDVAVNIHGKAKEIHNTHPIRHSILLNDGFHFEKGIIPKKRIQSI